MRPEADGPSRLGRNLPLIRPWMAPARRPVTVARAITVPAGQSAPAAAAPKKMTAIAGGQAVILRRPSATGVAPGRAAPLPDRFPTACLAPRQGRLPRRRRTRRRGGPIISAPDCGCRRGPGPAPTGHRGGDQDPLRAAQLWQEPPHPDSLEPRARHLRGDRQRPRSTVPRSPRGLLPGSPMSACEVLAARRRSYRLLARARTAPSSTSDRGCLATAMAPESDCIAPAWQVGSSRMKRSWRSLACQH
jgi:hypothetical protein